MEDNYMENNYMEDNINEDMDDFDDYLNNQDYYMDFPDYVAEQDEFQQKCYEWEEQERKDAEIEYLESQNNKLWQTIAAIENYIKHSLIDKVDKEKIKSIIEECYEDGK